jgi:hypothetical protein
MYKRRSKRVFTILQQHFRGCTGSVLCIVTPFEFSFQHIRAVGVTRSFEGSFSVWRDVGVKWDLFSVFADFFVLLLQPKSTNSGVYLFMRTHMDGKPDVVKALKEGRSVLANSYGQLKGIANNTEVSGVLQCMSNTEEYIAYNQVHFTECSMCRLDTLSFLNHRRMNFQDIKGSLIFVYLSRIRKMLRHGWKSRKILKICTIY